MESPKIMCGVGAGKWIRMNEGTFIGFLSSLIAKHGDDIPFDVEISIVGNLSLFPFVGSFTLKNRLRDVIIFCKELEQQKFPSCLRVISIYNSVTSYYIPEQFHEDFMVGYTQLIPHFTELLTSQNQSYTMDYKDDWIPDVDYLEQSEYIGMGHDTKQRLKIPCHIWNLPSTRDIYREQLMINLIALYLSVCSSEEHSKLLQGRSYLRFFLYQDNPNSSPYMNAYIRSIKECTYQSHKNTLENRPSDYLPCEINHGNTGFFYIFPLEEWKIKSIGHIERID